MDRYSTDFKVMYIEAYQNKKPLSKVDGVLEKSMRTIIQLYTRIDIQY